MSTKKIIKPLPYLVQRDSYPIAKDAKWLREMFGPILKRRLPSVYYSGWRSDFVVQYVQKHKLTHPFFVKADIAKFYPSVPHQHLTVEAQLAYKRLHSLEYVPKLFKKEFLPKASSFYNSLPISEYGIPLNSAFSKALAPLIYVRFFLDVKAYCDIKFIVFVDDVIFLCKNALDQEKVYQDYHNFLCSVGLQINLGKVQQGRFAVHNVDFCGWRFSGGYAGISPSKIASFLERIKTKAERRKKLDTREYIKYINLSIQGFGNYYKHGNVLRTFADLDAKIRTSVRAGFAKKGWAYPSNAELSQLGLRSLVDIKKEIKTSVIKKTDYNKVLVQQTTKKETDQGSHWVRYLQQMVNQNAQIIGLMQKLLKTTERIATI